MEDRKNEENKPLMPGTDKSGEEKTLRQCPKWQKLEATPNIEKIKKEKKTPPKTNKSPKTPMKTLPKDQGDDYSLSYCQSP